MGLLRDSTCQCLCRDLPQAGGGLGVERVPGDAGAGARLDGIAKEAGVGIGTLYRHFPTREALIEAAYRNELARLCDAVPGLLGEMAPDEALRAWMDRYVDYLTTKRGMADALRAVIASGGNPYAQSRGRRAAARSAGGRAPVPGLGSLGPSRGGT